MDVSHPPRPAGVSLGHTTSVARRERRIPATWRSLRGECLRRGLTGELHGQGGAGRFESGASLLQRFRLLVHTGRDQSDSDFDKGPDDLEI